MSWPQDDSLPRNHEGQLAGYQDGRYFTLGQASEMHPCEERQWTDWDLSIGVVSLDDGTFLALHGFPVREEQEHPSGRRRQWGGFAVWDRRYASRDEAVRSNVAYVIWMARKRLRDPRKWSMYSRMTEDRYRSIVAWAFEVAGRPVPKVYIAPPPTPPIVAPQADKHGQMGFAL